MLPLPSQPHPSDDNLSDPPQPLVSVDDDFEPSPIATIPSPDPHANSKRRRGEGSSISQAVDTSEVKKFDVLFFYYFLFEYFIFV